jgi:hypothetical protein
MSQNSDHIKSFWDRPIAIAIFTASITILIAILFTYLLVPKITADWNDKSKEKEIALIEAKENFEISHEATLEIARLLYARRERAAMLEYALKTKDAETVKDRKKLYDEAYFLTNSNLQSNLMIIRRAVGGLSKSFFEVGYEEYLVPRFKDLDRCITNRYHVFVGVTKDERSDCSPEKVSEKLAKSLLCISVYTEQLITYVKFRRKLEKKSEGEPIHDELIQKKIKTACEVTPS